MCPRGRRRGNPQRNRLHLLEVSGEGAAVRFGGGRRTSARAGVLIWGCQACVAAWDLLADVGVGFVLTWGTSSGWTAQCGTCWRRRPSRLGTSSGHRSCRSHLVTSAACKAWRGTFAKGASRRDTTINLRATGWIMSFRGCLTEVYYVGRVAKKVTLRLRRCEYCCLSLPNGNVIF